MAGPLFCPEDRESSSAVQPSTPSPSRDRASGVMSNTTVNATARKTLPLPSPSSTVFELHLAPSPAPGQHRHTQDSCPKPQHQRTLELQQQRGQTLLEKQRSAARNSHKQQKRAKHQLNVQMQLQAERIDQEQQPLSESTTTPSSTSTREQAPSPRVVFGPGTITRLPNELGRLRISSPLIISSPSRVSLAKRIQALVPNLNSRILDSAVVNLPARVIDDVVARISGRDCVISVGGGSAVNLARTVGFRKGIPHICIPTTYSGSEMPSLGERKSGLRDSKILPNVIIYDEDLTISVPKRISAPSAYTHPSESRHRSNKDATSWSFIHLPGV